MANPVAQTMFDIPGKPITSAIQATPYASIPNVAAAYPSLMDWRHVYDPHDSRGDRQNRESYENMKSSHEHSVIKQLDQISMRTTGRLVLAEIKTRPAFSVLIFPFDFLPMGRSWRSEVAAVTRPTDNSAARPVFLAGKGTGSSVDIYFTASRDPNHADETLLHELVHATRQVTGVRFHMPVNEGYSNLEEFIAVVVENVYRSEKRRTHLRDYRGVPIDPANFLDNPKLNPSPRLLLGQFRSMQPSFFAALAKIGPATASFNPVRQFDAEYLKLMSKIGRE